jgi:hypothetical protein
MAMPRTATAMLTPCSEYTIQHYIQLASACRAFLTHACAHRYVGSEMRWTEGFGGGKLGHGHAMDFLAGPGPKAGRSLREAGVPELYRRAARM